MNKIGESGL